MRAGSERDRPFFIEIRHSQSQDTYNISFPDCFYEIKKHIFARRIKTIVDFMNLLLCLKRPFIWLSRFRYRCGYGVHSPFAFSLITDVIYEKMSYYAYDSLEKEQKKIVEERGCNKGTQKVNRFLFRLVNKVQPATIVEVGRPSVTSLYLQSAKPSAEYLFASDLSELFLDTDVPVDFLYLNDYQNPCLLEEVFRVCVRRTTLKSVFVVHGICYSKEMRAFWKRLQADERVGITFDLYDIGLLFFDKTKIKQHYIVNF